MPTNQEDFSYPEPQKDPSDAEREQLKSKLQPSGSASLSTAPASVKPNLKSYIGTKVILARPMTSDDYKASKGQPYGQDENAHGYEVTYEDGYVSWSPKGVFERCYREITTQEKSLIYTANNSGQNNKS